MKNNTFVLVSSCPTVPISVCYIHMTMTRLILKRFCMRYIHNLISKDAVCLFWATHQRHARARGRYVALGHADVMITGYISFFFLNSNVWIVFDFWIKVNSLYSRVFFVVVVDNVYNYYSLSLNWHINFSKINTFRFFCKKKLRKTSSINQKTWKIINLIFSINFNS